METEWLKNVLKRKNEKRFAVCVTETGQYIGNAYLANIDVDEVEYSGLFIGEMEFWGKGFGTAACSVLCDFAFRELKVQRVYGFIRREHQASLTMVKKIGFKEQPWNDELIKVILTKNDFRQI